MADWIGTARSNYFRVKDERAFREWASDVGDLEVIADKDGRFGLIARSEWGDWPCWRYNDESENTETIDLFREVAKHLEDGSVAVFMEVGAEKLRYMTGNAWAVNSKGEEVAVSIGDIYDRATSLGSEVTPAEY